MSKLRVRHYPPRITVVRRDEPGDSMFFISEGEVEVRLPNGGSVALGEGAFFGEMALLTSSPRSTTIRAGSTLSMLAIRQDVFVRLVEENAPIAVGITRMLIDRLAKTNADLNRARAASSG